MTLRHYRRDLDSVFCILGTSENAITQSIAWTLSQCPKFLFTFLAELMPGSTLGELQVATQSFADDRGFTDIEIYEHGVLHVIVEAKKGWRLPQGSQLQRYVPRFEETSAPKGARLLISMSEASEVYASLHLPKAIGGVPVRHMSWRRVLRIVRDSYAKTRSFDEKRWLGQLSLFLGDIQTMQNQRSNEVFVVSLGAQEILKKTGYTWIDVVVRDRKYFHPVGLRGFPAEPVNYVGFRYGGKLQSVHHVASYEVVRNLQKRNKKWPSTDAPHFIYVLGPPMRPAGPIATGKIYKNGRVWCLIDTLLSGEFDTISEARDATKNRLAKIEE